MFLATDAWAQTAAAPAPGGPLAQFFGGPGSTIVMFALMFGVMYLLLIRPQSQEKKKLEAAIEKLQKGDKVLTTSGMVATVVTLEKSRVVLLIAEGVKVEFVRSAIAQVMTGEKA